MPTFVITTKGLHAASAYLDNLQVNIPVALERDQKTIANEFKRGLIEEIVAQDLGWTGRLINEIAYRKIAPRQYIITLPSYGVALDSMKPHFVPVSFFADDWYEGNKPLTHSHGAPRQEKGRVYVMKHPFIDAGIQRGLAKFRDKLENGEIVRTVRRKTKEFT